MSVKRIPFRKMEYYSDRGSLSQNWKVIADRCVEGYLPLYSDVELNANEIDGNIFNFSFNREDGETCSLYLLAMDWLTNVITAYKITRNPIYKETFEKYFSMFGEYIKSGEYLKSKYSLFNDHVIYAQILLVCKALSVFDNITQCTSYIYIYIYEILNFFKNEYAPWLADEKNIVTHYNHGVFEVLGLLHLSVLFGDDPAAKKWVDLAMWQINKLYENAYYADGVNTENSMDYFKLNNSLYKQVVDFCDYYDIKGCKKITDNIKKSEKAIEYFAHSDLTLPQIGDGNVKSVNAANPHSACFKDSGMAVIKVGCVYLTFKMKTSTLDHAHNDVSSITARYKGTDFILDSGQYNYNKFSSPTVFLRSTAAHSGVFPLFADAMFKKGFCDSVGYSEITDFEVCDSSATVKGKYKINSVEICREINVTDSEIIVRDSWECKEPTAIRQRFVIPKKLLNGSMFVASERTVTATADGVSFKYEINTDIPTAKTVVGFGVASSKYNECEQTLLLDTVAENQTKGSVTAKISFTEE